MSELQIWIIYHDNSQIADYRLAEDAVFRLFKAFYMLIIGVR